ncbi:MULTISPECIES: hypothetical protein [Gammaproteobacteria]|uniref:hypothetical protein n=1 Tax=Gammaproteobacteria TaxID=1236 RepID=UPI0003BF389A|nr:MULTISPECIES: hypothetical protein [Gammaproteobacteria]EHN8840750.1 hypothetical protein [Enterobacter hormaechei]ELC6457822.1 hypothetical protein [Enterobacter hormaechei]ELC6476305.1 hypothetical protein [Enterobacter hormaechei]ELD7988171.1 hypothetical protein [Enterobacter hormaechei]ELV3433073.1 hypothetical protein [Enterobacter hormaechei]
MILLIAAGFVFFVCFMLWVIYQQTIPRASYEIPKWQWDAMQDRFNELESEMEHLREIK